MSSADFDEKRIFAAREGDNTAVTQIINACMPYVEAVAAGYSVAGAARCDLIQEGLIGAVNAIFTYDPSKGAQFVTYMQRCVANSVASAVRTLNRQKHKPLSNFVELKAAERLVSGAAQDPETLLSMQESMDVVSACIRDQLTPLERDVLLLHIADEARAQIAARLNISEKSATNALSRARKKIKTALNHYMSHL